LTIAYTNLVRDLQELVGKGLSAAVDTQTSDVEVEVNGLMTYDRKVVKMDPEYVNKINQGYLPPIIKSNYSIFTDQTLISIYNEIKKGKIFYTTDGANPGINSMIYNQPFKISETTKIKSITVYDNDLISAVSEKSFEKVEHIPAIEGEDYKKGLKYGYYGQGIADWTKIPDFGSLTATEGGIAEKISINKSTKEEYFAMKFEGFVEVPTDGIYTFYSNSDDGTKLFLHDKLLVDNDFNHPMSEKSGDVALKKGKHPIQLLFFQGSGGKGLEVSYQGPGVKKQEIPAEAFYYK
jgi:hypothetical protein